MTFLPDGRLLVTDNQTRYLSLVTQTGSISDVPGLPERLGLFDVAISPRFATDSTIYFTYAEPAPAGTPRNGPYADDLTRPNGALALGSAQLVAQGSGFVLRNVKVVWRQYPYVVSGGEWGGRIAFSPDGAKIFVTAGDRAVYFPARALDNTLGKTIRLNLDGSIPSDNPYSGIADARREIWTAGHRNHYGLAFAPDGRLWSTEHGPKGGDEFNLIEPGNNYGWPVVSYGTGYTDNPGEITFARPSDGDGFAQAALTWTPAIAPAGMIFYSGSVYRDWIGDVLITGLVSKAIIRVRIDGNTAAEVQRIDMGERVREIEQAPDGSLWVLTDSPTGALKHLAPVYG